MKLGEIDARCRLPGVNLVGNLPDGQSAFLGQGHDLSQDIEPFLVRKFLADFPKLSFFHRLILSGCH